MAFPTVAGFGGSNSAGNVTTTTPDITALTGAPSAGDLIIVLVAKDGIGVFTWPAGWTVMRSLDFGAALVEVRYRVWVGGDSNPAITHASEGTAWQVYRIAAGSFEAATAPATATGVVEPSGSANPNPPNLDPSTWGTEDTLWIAYAANDGNVAITAGPATPGTWTNFQNDRWANTGGCGIASSRLQSAVASVDPGVFTMATEQWGTSTIAVRPFASVADNFLVRRSGSAGQRERLRR